MKKHDADTLGQPAGTGTAYSRNHFHLLTLTRDREHEHLACIQEVRISNPSGQYRSLFETAKAYISLQVMDASGSTGLTDEMGDTPCFTKRFVPEVMQYRKGLFSEVQVGTKLVHGPGTR